MAARIIGTVLGAAAGSAIPGAGTMAGAKVGGMAGEAIGGLIDSGGARKRADNAFPELYDPTQLALLAEIQQKKNSINTGSAFAADMGAIDAGQAGTDATIRQVTGGDVGGTIQALLASGMQANRAKNNILAQADQQSQFYNNMYADTLNRISSRAMELRLARSSQNRAEWAQGAQDSFANGMNVLARTDPSGIDWNKLFARHATNVEMSKLNPLGITGPVAGSAPLLQQNDQPSGIIDMMMGQTPTPLPSLPAYNPGNILSPAA